jgi:hypothetical protein|nr:MAG TPA: Acyl-CoA carboxylase epsilon subunit [Crassvirales sp.]
MKVIEFWDRKSPINGLEAEKILKDVFFKNARKLFLVKDNETGVVYNIENVDIIKDVVSLPGNPTDEEIAQAYLNEL